MAEMLQYSICEPDNAGTVISQLEEPKEINVQWRITLPIVLLVLANMPVLFQNSISYSEKTLLSNYKSATRR
jgi:hypothetical protein